MSSESHHAHIDPQDSFAKIVGLLAACFAVLLSIFTISAHRAHTETIMMQDEATDQWSYYQAKRIRDYQLEMNGDLLKVLAASHPDTAKLTVAYHKKREEYKNELDDIKKKAEEKGLEGQNYQKRALRFDLAEGTLEISLVMSSLYFIARN